MQPRIYDNCKLHGFDRDTLKFEILDPGLVGVRYWNGIYDYYLLSGNRRMLIVQVINEKKAAAKFLTLIRIYNEHGI